MAYKVHLDICPFCGKGDTAQLIPHGIGIAKFFIVRCVVKRGGCGASVTGKTRRMAEAAWNRNPPNDEDCPAVLAGAFDEFKEAMGIETVCLSEQGATNAD